MSPCAFITLVAALLLRTPLALSAEPAEKVALDNPAVRYVLQHTREGRSLLDVLQPAAMNASIEDRVSRLIQRVESKAGNKIAEKLAKITESRFVAGMTLQAPLREWDRVMLQHAAQDHLKHRAVPGKGVILEDPAKSPGSVRPAAKNISEDQRQWVQKYDDWVKWANREKALTNAERGGKLFEEAKSLFGGLGINYSELELGDGTPALKIEPGRGNRLNLLAQGLHQNLDQTLLAYSPQRLLEAGYNGAFLPGEKTLLMSHLSLLEVRSDETMLHEALHAKFRDELGHGRVTHFHGYIKNVSDAAFEARFSYTKGGYMSFEEVATFAMGLHNSANRIKSVGELSTRETQWALNRMIQYARQGENASVYAKGVLSEALEQLKSNPQIAEFKNVQRAHAVTPESVLSFRMPEIGQDFEVHIPLREAQGVTKKDLLEQELKARIGLFQEMQDHYREIGEMVGELDGSPWALEKLAKAARGPRAVSLPFVRGIVWTGPGGCLRQSLFHGRAPQPAKAVPQ